METRYDMDNFEQILKEHADQFSMMPSKRVWNGVYNSLHPGSKWPSLTMLLFFLLTLVGIGPLNQSSKKYTVNSLPDNNQESVSGGSDSKIFGMHSFTNSMISSTSPHKSSGKVVAINSNSAQLRLNQETLIQNQSTVEFENATPNFSSVKNELGAPENSTNIDQRTLRMSGSTIKKDVAVAIVVNIDSMEQNPASLVSTSKGVLVNKTIDKAESFVLKENIFIEDPATLLSFLQSNPGKSILIGIEDIDIDQEEIGQDAAAAKKRSTSKSKTTWIFFATPAITTTYFTGKSPENMNIINASPLIVNPRQIGNTMRYNARVGLSIGTEFNYEFANNWEIVSGTQLSYSGYNILAHKVHPTFSYLYLKDEETNSMQPKKYITYYGSGEGLDEVVLHNTSIQLSIPVGIKHSVWKNNNVEIKIGTTLQPSLIVKGQAYILSSDGRNYVNDPELMRPINLSGEFSSSISFQGEKVKWHIGPTIRYQAVSSYKKIYPVNEHLIDYGIRIGISK